MNIQFKLIEKNKMESILPLLHELEPSIPESVTISRLSEMLESGYECVGIYHDSQLIGICGIWMLVKYYIGRHIEVDNVFIREQYRSSGIGKQLNEWLRNLANSRNCESIELNCYIHNEKGNHFWESDGYTPIGLHYQKKLKIKKHHEPS